ncbi:DNA-3-methyladenine glycosylase I [Thiorhodovibrio winogradskyi]|uniref:DNA-3-methyladenine glycosylase I n=2 Tax=Thiorhodovibrio TaxID=61593 RepID=UPI001913D7FC|nr:MULTISPECIES: DNA-3-methyladenine glycosylase I [Thiorhodovibrio]MBK5970022.1 DNA-3-methyladenine glycosylase [Thiorhodovibrio winogradskyi]WPL12949.1 DNA-3-methyladenine glycosylase 1 [Thiorhodovibrio litoralis]
MMTAPSRCGWCGTDPLYTAYHDQEWGVPEHKEQRLFEFLLLEGAQAGLSWITILRKREGYREAFAEFDPERIARFGDQDIARLLSNPAIVRNRRKIEAAIGNARALVRLWEAGDTLHDRLWQHVDGQPRQNHWQSLEQVPASTAESDAMSRDLRALGFKFVGPTICYALMQAVGLVNDHLVDCFRHAELYQDATG